MKQSERTVFKCDHCGKNYLVKHACGTHEKFCPKNPENKHACFNCKHLEVGRNDDHDLGFSEKTFKCSKLGTELHSFKAERIKHSCLGHTERMPLTCPDFKDQYVYADTW
jgi:hypothetical protein